MRSDKVRGGQVSQRRSGKVIQGRKKSRKMSKVRKKCHVTQKNTELFHIFP